MIDTRSRRENKGNTGLRVPPQDVEAEMAVLAGCLINPDIIPQVQGILTLDDFYRESHKHIFEALCTLGKGADIITLEAKLKSAGKLDEIGGMGYLAELTGFMSTSAGWRAHAEIVKEKSQRRQVIMMCSVAADRAFRDDEELQGTLSGLKGEIVQVEREQAPEIESALTVVQTVFKEIERRHETGNQFVGIRTGLANIDNNLFGLEPASSTYLIARPSIGKSALAITIADYIAEHEGPVLYVALESNRHSLTRRRLAARSRVFYSRIRRGDIEDGQWDRLTEAAGKLTDIPLLIADHSRYRDPQTLCSLAQTIHMQRKLKAIIIDHIQLSQPRKRLRTRHDEISQASADYQTLFKDLNVSGIILCQLSREIERRTAASKRNNPYPQLNDMKESGDLEQNADIVWGLWRKDKQDPSTRLEQLKGRETDTWVTWLRFDRFIQRFYDGEAPTENLPFNGSETKEKRNW